MKAHSLISEIKTLNTTEDIGEFEVMMYIHGTLRPIKAVKLQKVPQSISERAKEEKPKFVIILK